MITSQITSRIEYFMPTADILVFLLISFDEKSSLINGFSIRFNDSSETVDFYGQPCIYGATEMAAH